MYNEKKSSMSLLMNKTSNVDTAMLETRKGIIICLYFAYLYVLTIYKIWNGAQHLTKVSSLNQTLFREK